MLKNKIYKLLLIIIFIILQQNDLAKMESKGPELLAELILCQLNIKSRRQKTQPKETGNS